MAGLGNITFKIDDYFLDTRISICANLNCVFNTYKKGSANCEKKIIEIDQKGNCKHCMFKEDNHERSQSSTAKNT